MRIQHVSRLHRISNVQSAVVRTEMFPDRVAVAALVMHIIANVLGSSVEGAKKVPAEVAKNRVM